MTAKPLICTFYQLAYALRALHQDDRALLASLHDIWLLGAPSPGSIVRDPRHLDERQPMRVRGVNFIERLVLPGPLATWIKETAGQRGMTIEAFDSATIVQLVSAVMGGKNYQIPQGLKVTK
jgi:hypothetical protein